MAAPTLKIDGARFIVTVDPARRIIRDGAIVIAGQRIVQVGKATALQHVTADRVIDASEMVVTDRSPLEKATGCRTRRPGGWNRHR